MNQEQNNIPTVYCRVCLLMLRHTHKHDSMTALFTAIIKGANAHQSVSIHLGFHSLPRSHCTFRISSEFGLSSARRGQD